MTAASVFPSPVCISTMCPESSASAATIWTSNGRIPRTRRVVRDSEGGGRRAEKGEGEERDGLGVRAGGDAANERDGCRRTGEADGRENDAGMTGREGRDERREHQDGESQ